MRQIAILNRLGRINAGGKIMRMKTYGKLMRVNVNKSSNINSGKGVEVVNNEQLDD